MDFSFLERWPKDTAGIPEKAALLCTESDFPDRIHTLGSFLEAFEIPHIFKRRGSGDFSAIQPPEAVSRSTSPLPAWPRPGSC